MSERQLVDLPRVSISVFKANPSAYLESGALVTNHDKPRAAFLPLGTGDDAESLNVIKAQLLLLGRMADPAQTERELEELAEARDAEPVGAAR